MAYLPELHRCSECGIDLGAENGDGMCSHCEQVLEVIDNLLAACRMALAHGESKQYVWSGVRETLRTAIASTEAAGYH